MGDLHPGIQTEPFSWATCDLTGVSIIISAVIQLQETEAISGAM